MAEITNIVQKGKENYLIFLDNSYFCTLNAETVVKSKLKVGMFIEKEEIETAQEENEKLTAFNKSINFLASMKSEKQIKDYLFQKGYTRKVIEATIEKLKYYNYIDDKNYAVQYVKTFKLSKGKRLLKFDLKTKGICDILIDEVCSQIENQEEAICNVSEKYMRNKEVNQKNLVKLFKYLSAKGFDFSDISIFIKRKYNKFEGDENE